MYQVLQYVIQFFCFCRCFVIKDNDIATQGTKHVIVSGKWCVNLCQSNLVHSGMSVSMKGQIMPPAHTLFKHANLLQLFTLPLHGKTQESRWWKRNILVDFSSHGKYSHWQNSGSLQQFLSAFSSERTMQTHLHQVLRVQMAEKVSWGLSVVFYFYPLRRVFDSPFMETFPSCSAAFLCTNTVISCEL